MTELSIPLLIGSAIVVLGMLVLLVVLVGAWIATRDGAGYDH